MIAGVLLIAVLAHLAPPFLADAVGGTLTAWEYVCYGCETAALWLLAAGMRRRVAWWAVCGYGFFESVQRPLCRALYPMDRAPKLPAGATLCDATGLPFAMLSPIIVGLLLAIFVRDLVKPWNL